ncbi:MAG: UPF0175 family protein [Candidatus Electrothrix sp.]
MSVNVTIDVPETSFSILRTTPQAFGQALLLAAAVKWYEIGKISQSYHLTRQYRIRPSAS